MDYGKLIGYGLVLGIGLIVVFFKSLFAKKAECGDNSFFIYNSFGRKEYPFSVITKMECVLSGNNSAGWYAYAPSVEGLKNSRILLLQGALGDSAVEKKLEAIRLACPDIQWVVPQGVFKESSEGEAAATNPVTQDFEPGKRVEIGKVTKIVVGIGSLLLATLFFLWPFFMGSFDRVIEALKEMYGYYILFAAIGLGFLFGAVWCFASKMTFDANRLYIKTLFKSSEIAFADISSVQGIMEGSGRSRHYSWYVYVISEKGIEKKSVSFGKKKDKDCGWPLFEAMKRRNPAIVFNIF